MDLIYTNQEKEDIGVLQDYTLDLAFGCEENDFECNLVRENHCCETGFYLYFEDTEYGGIIDDISIDTEKDEVTYYGRTWHGILNSKVLEMDAGEDYLILSGDAKTVLNDLIRRIGLSNLFVVSEESSGITISNYKMDRYIKGYDGTRKMLKAFGAKLKMSFKKGFVELSAEPFVDYSEDDQFDNDQISFSIKKYGNPVNHVICLGKGNLSEREVIHLYADDKGNISETQVFTGIQEVTEIYENVNAEGDELKQGGIEIIKKAWSSDEVNVDFDFEDESFDVGDYVGVVDLEVGISVRKEIDKKIVSIKNGEETVSYPQSSRTNSSSIGSSSGSGERSYNADSVLYNDADTKLDAVNVQEAIVKTNQKVNTILQDYIDSMTYKDGDLIEWSFSSDVVEVPVVYGLLTTGGTELNIGLMLPKNIPENSTFTLDVFKANIHIPKGGYLGTDGKETFWLNEGTDFLKDASSVLVGRTPHLNYIRIRIVLSTAFTTNNIPITGRLMNFKMKIHVA